jgi:uncharacterized membrane protein
MRQGSRRRQKSKIENQKSEVQARAEFFQILPLRLRSGQAFAFCLLPFDLFVPLLLCAQERISFSALEEGPLFIFHPIVVHFAIALTLFGFAVDWLGSLRGQMYIQQIGRACFLAGVIALGLAVVSGWVEHTLPRPVSVFDEQMRNVFFWHEYLGYGLFALFLVLAVVRLRIQARLPMTFVLLGTLGLVGLVIQGYLGGELVYRYGAGVRAVQVLSERLGVSEQKKAPE